MYQNIYEELHVTLVQGFPENVPPKHADYIG